MAESAKHDYRFRRSERLIRQTEFQRVFDAGSSYADKALIVYAAPNDLGWSRLGRSVSRRVGNAVVRNYIRRRLREAFRLNKQELPVGYDFVVVARRAAGDRNWDLARSLRRLTQKAVKKKNASPNTS